MNRRVKVSAAALWMVAIPLACGKGPSYADKEQAAKQQHDRDLEFGWSGGSGDGQGSSAGAMASVAPPPPAPSAPLAPAADASSPATPPPVAETQPEPKGHPAETPICDMAARAAAKREWVEFNKGRGKVARKSAIIECAHRAIEKDPTFKDGLYTFRVDVGPCGHVDRAESQIQGNVDPDFVTCVSSEALALRYPPHAGDGTTSVMVSIKIASPKKKPRKVDFIERPEKKKK